MTIRRTIRDILQPLCKRIETKLEESVKKQTAQKFRRIQYKAFGLSKYEWGLLRTYFESYEQLGVITQRSFVESKASYLSDMRVQERISPSIKEIEEYRLDREMYARMVKQNATQCYAARVALKLAAMRVGHTPVFRAVLAQREEDRWYMCESLVARCRKVWRVLCKELRVLSG
ncbi:hypothetical protein BJX70DRAFT_289595 [Aspergillus crustosus]